MSAIAQRLESIVGAAAVRAPDQLDAAWKTAISQSLTPAAPLPCVVYPDSLEQLAEVVACAHREGWRIMPCGQGSKLVWGGLVTGVDVVISTARYQTALDHAVGDLTVTATAGTSFQALQTALQQENQFLPLDPAYEERATLGGIVATADAGSWRQRYGGVRDMLIGIGLVRYDGEVVKAGGKVVKNVAGYDLMKLMTGSYGTLGLISELTFRTYPLPDVSETVVLAGEADSLAAIGADLRSSVLTPTRLDWLSPKVMQALDLEPTFGLAIRFQNIAESVAEQRDRVLRSSSQNSLKSSRFSEAADEQVWQQIQQHLWSAATEPHVICKLGTLPSEALSTLQAAENALGTQHCSGRIHGGSGIGLLRCRAADLSVNQLQQVRQVCESHRGYLTVLEAPVALKETMDVWGYPGNALELMRRIKAQFDPRDRISPHRFVGGI